MVPEKTMPGILYVVATPIGNLEDLSPRARQVLQQADLIAAEDTRHTAKLLRHFGISTPSVALHEHNERAQSGRVVQRLQAGESVALVSDAGTPLISDPGFRLVRDAAALGLPVRPVPGPSAAMAALSAAGLPTDRFVFEGFLPARSAPRRAALQAFSQEPRTAVFFESPRRVGGMLTDAREVLGGERAWVLARELTKLHEEWVRGGADELLAWVAAYPDRLRGEFVMLLEGAPTEASADRERLEVPLDGLLRELLNELPLKTAVAMAARLSGHKKNAIYTRALELSQ